jgi:predicted transcriptional regulator
MPPSLIELAKELTLALIQTGNLLPTDVQETLQQTHTTLTALKAQEEIGTTSTVSVAQTAPVDWRKSITKHAVTCLACGHAFKQLTIRHLRQHGLDARSYRTKYGIPGTQPLAARETTVRRRQIVRETRPWEKTATFRRAKMQDGSEASEPTADTVSEETEAPAQPKRQRKTTPKKQTARKKRSER